MANYYCASRTNYFRVKDPDAFLKWANELSLNVWPGGDNKQLFAVSPDQYSDDGGFPSTLYNEKNDDWTDFDFAEELSRFLADGSVAVIMSSGAEKLRYISGYAVAINNKQEREQLWLSDIYKRAAHLGTEITAAEY
jgi:hypothetical protein